MDVCWFHHTIQKLIDVFHKLEYFILKTCMLCEILICVCVCHVNLTNVNIVDIYFKSVCAKGKNNLQYRNI